MASKGEFVLSQGVGYGVVVGIGFLFAGIMWGLSWVQNRYTRYDTKTSEEFNTASRSVKPGLIASGIVCMLRLPSGPTSSRATDTSQASWTWAATLLQSSTVAYEYGVAGPYVSRTLDCLVVRSLIACTDFGTQLVSSRWTEYSLHQSNRVKAPPYRSSSLLYLLAR